jgi:pimeloyl-ACP methyl ester carboxylesterase
MSSITPPHLEVLSSLPAVDEGLPPLLFVHGLGHGAWCWQHWMRGVADAGHPAYAVSLRGHAGSPGRVRTARLSQYVADVVSVAESLPRPPVLVGHSMGGLVVQQALAVTRARAGVLVASVSHRPAFGSLWSVARRHPVDAAKICVGMTLPMRTEYMFENLTEDEARPFVAQTCPESPIAQIQLLAHRPAPVPPAGVPMLVLGTPQDRLVPISDVRRTATRYGATLHEFSGIGHNLMLDRGWERPLATLVDWLGAEVGLSPSAGTPPRGC